MQFCNRGVDCVKSPINTNLLWKKYTDCNVTLTDCDGATVLIVGENNTLSEANEVLFLFDSTFGGRSADYLIVTRITKNQSHSATDYYGSYNSYSTETAVIVKVNGDCYGHFKSTGWNFTRKVIGIYYR